MVLRSNWGGCPSFLPSHTHTSRFQNFPRKERILSASSCSFSPHKTQGEVDLRGSAGDSPGQVLQLAFNLQNDKGVAGLSPLKDARIYQFPHFRFSFQIGFIFSDTSSLHSRCYDLIVTKTYLSQLCKKNGAKSDS